MEISELNNIAAYAKEQVKSFRRSLDLDQLEEDIAALEQEMSVPNFWDKQEKAQKTIDELNQKKSALEELTQLSNGVSDLETAISLLREEEDPELMKEAESDAIALKKAVDDYELSMLLDGPHDHSNAILEIHPGAGGTESQDWGSMLLRMYTRWAEHHNYEVEMLDYQSGDEAGIKSVTLLIKGYNAFGYLKSEKGVHRLVRISPFDAAGKRHTSFCSVEVTPEIDTDITIDINPDDLKIDTYRASGAGGQHINKTSSAVRITHIPTGIVVQSQAQRSQFKNRDQAMSMLKAKLYQLEEEKKEAHLAELRGEQKEIGWGSQIRNYVFHPYSMVKDLRTGYETGNIAA
ncbi:peptide chain release factor 2, partial [Bavariicoccus seileri]